MISSWYIWQFGETKSLRSCTVIWIFNVLASQSIVVLGLPNVYLGIT